MNNRNGLTMLAVCGSSILALSMPAPAIGAKPVVVSAPNTKVVEFNDIDLSSPDGGALLLQRVGTATKEVCSRAGSDSGDFLVERSCRKFAWRGSKPQVADAMARAKLGKSSSSAAMSILVTGR